jgi:hypothetical protein
MSKGQFEIYDVPEGEYILHAAINDTSKATFNTLMPSYQTATYKWPDAQTLSTTCGDTAVVTITMTENSAASASGSGSVSGLVRYLKDGQEFSSGTPVDNALVLLVDDSNDLPVDYVLTDASGAYTLTEVVDGNYTVYVDIPGLTLDAAHQLSITSGMQQYKDLNYAVDTVANYNITVIDGTPTGINSNIEILETELFPNPAREYVHVRSSLFNGNVAELTLISQSGTIVRTADFGGAETITGQIEFDLTGISSGQYLLRIESNDKVVIKKVMVKN